MTFKQLSLIGILSLLIGSAGADVNRDLPLPKGKPTANQIADQVYFANHFYAFKNFSITEQGRLSAVLINKDSDGSISRTAVERFLNNNYPLDGSIKSRGLAIFRSGMMDGTGMLVTVYTNPSLPDSYMVWVPQLRKIRRFAQPEQNQSWGGSVFTFGDVTLRKPSDETQQLLGKKKMRTCLGVIKELEGKPYRYVDTLPKRSCRNVGKEVYVLKSTPKKSGWWYDYRISYVDVHSFANYRTMYFKNGKMIKIIDRDWGLVKGAKTKDPRALFWKYWYGVDLVNNRESWAVVPQGVIEFNTNRPNRFWTDRTLRRITR